MRYIYATILTTLLLSFWRIDKISAKVGNLVCYYDSSSFLREGPAKLSLADFEPALQFCNYVIYGYAIINRKTYQLQPRWKEVEVDHEHYRDITNLKRKYPHVRMLLSVGGDKDIEWDESLGNKYLELLEDPQRRQVFVQSALTLIKENGFDGLDLAWQFPKNHAKAVRSLVGRAWNSVKNLFRGKPSVDDKAEEHKQQFTELVRELNSTLRRQNLQLTLTMLPNVNANLFVDIFTVSTQLDFVNLATFDFQTPERDPKIADNAAPLYDGFERAPEQNINYQVQVWLNNTMPSEKIIIGVPAFGRAWIMGKDSGITGYPPISKTLGVAPAGRYTGIPGLLSWPEICEKLQGDKQLTGEDAPLRKVGDPTKRYGTYAYRSADENGEHGIWVSYDDPATAANKADFARGKGLGGVALFDVSLDDFRGTCAGEKFPILRSIKFKL